MSEMLGNHYFNFRKYSLAEKTFEKILPDNYYNISLLKKLTICYTQSQKINSALKLLYHLIKFDNSLILQKVKYDDDCPCRDLINSIEKETTRYETDFNRLTSLGVLWCYCNYKTALKYFKKAALLNSSNGYLNRIIKSLKSYTNQKQFKIN